MVGTFGPPERHNKSERPLEIQRLREGGRFGPTELALDHSLRTKSGGPK